MFPPSVFSPSYFAPSYFPPGIPVAAEPRRGGGGLKHLPGVEVIDTEEEIIAHNNEIILTYMLMEL